MTIIERIDALHRDMADGHYHSRTSPEMISMPEAVMEDFVDNWPAIRRALVAAKAVDDSASCNDYGDLCADPDRLDELTEALAALDVIK